MSKDTIKQYGSWLTQYLPAVAGALIAWGTMKAEVSALKVEMTELRANAKAQDAKIVTVEVESGKVGAKLDGILRELQALREDIRGRARSAGNE
jgi:hypothetical protein